MVTKLKLLFSLFWAALSILSYAEEDRPELLLHDFDSGDLVNALGGSSGAWILNPDDENQYCKLSSDGENARGHVGFSLKLAYDLESSGSAQGGFWTQLLKRDLGEYDTVEFYVKADPGGATSKFRVEFKKSKDVDSHEKIVGSFLVGGVNSTWQKVSIPLNRMTGLSDWSDIDEFVVVLKDRMVDKKTGILYFDDIRLVRTGSPGPSISDAVPKKIEKASDLVSGVERARVLVSRLYGFPREVVLKKTFPADTKEFLREVAKDTWGYFRDIIDKDNGLPLDNVAWTKDAILGENTFVGDYTNVTNIGLYLMCVVAASDLGFIERKEATERIVKVFDTIEKMESYRGFLYNYYDTTTAERTSNFISYVDEGWLTIGIIVVKNAMPEMKGRCEKFLGARDFSFFYDAVEGQMFHGFYTNVEVYSEYHYGAFYTEPRAISYMAIGREQVPEEHWFMMARTFPRDYAWQSQEPKGRIKKKVLGHEYYGGFYMYRDKPHVPSWGGSMFEALMPTLVIDESSLAPEGLGLNDARHVQGQIMYAMEDLKYPVWGMSPCSIPPGNGYSEYGVPALGMNPYKQDVITPHAAFLALEFASEESVKNLRKLLALYPIYGEYGFYDAVNLKTGEISYKYLCLDQAMSFISLSNYLSNGMIRNYFMSDPIAQKSKQLLMAEKLFEAQN